MLGDLVLDGKDVAKVAVEALLPKVITVRGIDELRGDTKAIAGATDAAV